ncbi:Serine/threonine-protein kinase tousled-like 1 [Nymphon striatum]|nr:Serine/threonine-protein kinase tousled-like 1 [Nymphon striatum]
MDNLHSLDPRKQELLEARILGNRQGNQSGLANLANTSLTSNSGLTGCILNNQDSNLSSTSISSSISDKESEQQTPEKQQPSRIERKRKRKDDAKQPRPDNKKINEYFKHQNNSPSRYAGAKSPSPQGSYHMFPPSPQQNMMTSPTSIHDIRTVAPPSTDYSMLCHTLPVLPAVSKLVQTEFTVQMIGDLETKATTDLEMRDNKIEELQRSNDELRRQLAAQQKVVEKHKENLKRCIDVTKELLIEKSTMEKKAARQKCMQNRLKLGQFVTQRQGATFVENWVDGYAFNEIIKKQEEIAAEKDEIDRLKKLLNKKKPSVSQPKSKSTIMANGAISNSSLNSPSSNLPNGDFAKPEPPKDRGLSWQEYYEQEERFKLRQAALKKEDTDLQLNMEKLERERNLHIRELKRIHNEDQSRFNHHPVLNEGYLLLTLLGKGGFSEVHKAFDLKEQRYVACKIHQLNKDWKDDKKANYIKHALREYNIHKTLDHPRVVRLYDVFEIDANSFCTVLEYCDGHDLDFYLKQHKSMPEREARFIMMQVVSALKYLNQIKPPVIHYDLKPGNILLGSGMLSGEIKITDFGLSKIMDDESYSPELGMDLTSQGAGTYWYLPPECFVVGKNPPKISSKVDVWSVGVIFYQCLYGKKVTHENQNAESQNIRIFHKINQKKD